MLLLQDIQFGAFYELVGASRNNKVVIVFT